MRGLKLRATPGRVRKARRESKRRPTRAVRPGGGAEFHPVEAPGTRGGREGGGALKVADQTACSTMRKEVTALIASEPGISGLEGNGESSPSLLTAKYDSSVGSIPPMRYVGSLNVELNAPNTETYSNMRPPPESVWPSTS